MNQINRKILESVRFRYAESHFFSKKTSPEEERSGTDQEGHDFQKLYPSEHELLGDILSKGNVKHARQLHYLAENHVNTILKLRYVLHPFSFVFLLEGNHQFHIVLETLHTEEATYIWHFDKGSSSLSSNLTLIDNALQTIKNKGRQEYLESQPQNFGRIIHDYSGDRKGFVLWRDALEERLY